jgi:membrane protease YdiL (CAAX protease family)
MSPSMTNAAGVLRRHPGVAATLAALGLVILANAAFQHDLGRAALYLTVLALSVLWIDLVFARWPIPDGVVRVRGAGLELVILAASFASGLFWLFARFVRGVQPPAGLFRLAWLGLLIGCVFNALPAIVLLARGYRLRDLGLEASGLRAVPFVMTTFAAAALFFAPQSATWQGAIAESGGSIWSLVGTALLAAVPEEFFRFAWQTRAGAWLGRPAVGWLIASSLWAVLHTPKDWSESHAIVETITGAINIVPLGLLWGYLTHRSRSMLPSIALHATNLWGLQNLM